MNTIRKLPHSGSFLQTVEKGAERKYIEAKTAKF